MGLREAVKDIINVMKCDRTYETEEFADRYIFALETALKASESYDSGMPPLDKFMAKVKDMELKKAQREAEEAKVTLQRQEHGVTTAELVDDDGMMTLIPIDPAMPVGAKTMVNGVVYEMKEKGKLTKVEK